MVSVIAAVIAAAGTIILGYYAYVDVVLEFCNTVLRAWARSQTRPTSTATGASCTWR